MVTDLVGRTGADKTGPTVYRSCPSWSRIAAGMNEVSIGLRCADLCARLEGFVVPRPSIEHRLVGRTGHDEGPAFRAGLNTHTAASGPGPRRLHVSRSRDRADKVLLDLALARQGGHGEVHEGELPQAEGDSGAIPDRAARREALRNG